MFKSVVKLLYSQTGRDTAVVFTGTIVNIIVGGIFFIFVPRILGPADYGLFSTVLATALMVTSIANFGLDTGILRFAKSDRTVIPLAFKIYLTLGLITALIGFVLSPAIASWLNSPQISQLLQIAFAGTIFLLLSNFFTAALQAKSQFTKASIVSISSNAARLLILFIGIAFFQIDLMFLTALFFFVPIVSVILGKIYLPIKFEKSQNSAQFFKYNFFVAAALVVSSVPYDNYILLMLAGPTLTGLYAAPFKILTFAYQLGGNFTRVLSSRFSSFSTNAQAIEFSKKSLIVPAVLSLGLIFLIILSKPVINLIFGADYQDSAVILQILSVGFIFFFISTIPSSITLYYFGKSNISLIITVIRYLGLVILLVVLVPPLKAVGAALAFSLSELISLILLSGYSLIKFHRNER